MQALAESMCQMINVPYNCCLAAINELQSNAIDKLKARDDFAKTGKATIKVRVPNRGVRLFTIQIKLDELTENLYELVASELEIASTR